MNKKMKVICIEESRKNELKMNLKNCTGMSHIDGILLVNKPKGPTSNQVLQVFKRKLKVKKIGHTGTLDPLAEGLLVFCVERATRMASYWIDCGKEYEACIQLGEKRDTDDAEGTVLESSSYRPSKTEVSKTLSNFRGEIEQEVPLYSAVKIQGKSSYRYAREGKVPPVRKKRRVQVYSLELVDFQEDQIRIYISCSKGTYIRSIARDLGSQLGSFAYLKDLKRTQVGPFSLSDSRVVQDIRNETEESLRKRIIACEELLLETG